VGRKFGEFGKSSMIRQIKTIQIFTYNYNLLAESIHLPNLFCQMLKMSKFARLSHYMVLIEPNHSCLMIISYVHTVAKSILEYLKLKI